MYLSFDIMLWVKKWVYYTCYIKMAEKCTWYSKCKYPQIWTMQIEWCGRDSEGKLNESVVPLEKDQTKNIGELRRDEARFC